MFLLTNHVSVRVSHALFIWSTGEYKSLCEEKYNHYVFTRKQETMSQSLLKCTICGGDHYIFHCINKCGVCSGDNRQCSCPVQPPQKKKRKALQSNQQPEDKPSYQGLKKSTTLWWKTTRGWASPSKTNNRRIKSLLPSWRNKKKMRRSWPI